MLESAKKLRLVILDACRDNPFATSMARTMASRSVGRGLAKVETQTSDTLIAFAARAGSIALDGQGANSPFSFALLKHLTTPGLDVRLAFGRIRDDVLASTDKKQEPFVYGALGGDTVAIMPSSDDRVISPVSPDRLNDAAQAWAAARETKSVAVLEAFLRTYGDSFYSELAKARLKDLQASLTPPNIDIERGRPNPGQAPAKPSTGKKPVQKKPPSRTTSVAACKARWSQSKLSYCKPNCPPSLVRQYLNNWIDCG
jgi:Caspase domain